MKTTETPAVRDMTAIVSDLAKAFAVTVETATAKAKALDTLAKAKAEATAANKAFKAFYGEAVAVLKNTAKADKRTVTAADVNRMHKAMRTAMLAVKTVTVGYVNQRLATLRGWYRLPEDARGMAKKTAHGKPSGQRGTFTVKAAAAAAVAALETLLNAHKADSAGRRLVADALAAVKKLVAERVA